MAESRVYQTHRFNRQNYQLWRRQMEIYMTENKLKPYILDIIPRPAANTQAWDDQDAAAQAFIMRGLELDQLKHLTDCTTAAQMWSRLRTVHSERSEQSAQVLLEKFINSKMNEEESMADHRQSNIARAKTERYGSRAERTYDNCKDSKQFTRQV
ncbi:copia protein [Lasius niger]|uniref:Copia protein n=1 Tax=Lasius niger TaxID=67767 RepID=A0A0J7K7Z1_LASNI|nr:copia protein [Lasius niger]